MHSIIDGDLFGCLAPKDLWAGDRWLLGIERSTTQSWMLTKRRAYCDDQSEERSASTQVAFLCPIETYGIVTVLLLSLAVESWTHLKA